MLKGHQYCAPGGDTGQGRSAIIPWKLPSYYSSFMPGKGGGGFKKSRREFGYKFKGKLDLEEGGVCHDNENGKHSDWTLMFMKTPSMTQQFCHLLLKMFMSLHG